MFTGIIQKTAPLRAVAVQGKGLHIAVETPSGWKLKKGQSVAVDGICLTVTKSTTNTFEAELMHETVQKTTGNSFREGRVVNLERALKLSDLLDGHLIQGHVDGRATITAVQKKGMSTLLTLSIPKPLTKKTALHGSIAVNGASLTVAQQTGATITVALIPYTLAHTNLGTLKKGSEVNVETDFLARHHSIRKYATVGRNATRGVRKKTRG